MILDDQYITKDMFIKDSYKGNNYANNNAVMFDLQNGKQNVLCLCANRHIAESIAEALNLLDNANDTIPSGVVVWEKFEYDPIETIIEHIDTIAEMLEDAYTQGKTQSTINK